MGRWECGLEEGEKAGRWCLEFRMWHGLAQGEVEISFTARASGLSPARPALPEEDLGLTLLQNHLLVEVSAVPQVTESS